MQTGGVSPVAIEDVGPHRAASIWQLVNSVLPFVILLYAMYRSLDYSYWLTLALGVLAAGFMVRIFIIQHDCGHGSFFRSRKANNRVGMFCSLITLIPYYYWRRMHALHHATSGDLDRRGFGDMAVYTVSEYLALSRWQRFTYRIYRNPLAFLVFGPISLYFVINRLPYNSKQASKRDRRNLHATNILLVIFFLGIGFWIGFPALLMIAAPVLFIAGGSGIWLFYIQHQFEHTYWKRSPEWNAAHAALQGSSFYKLPKLLQWFTGNIGFHHIHHLKETIPNYRLEKIYVSRPELQDVVTITLRSSLKTAFLSVWDEQQQRLISFRELARLQSEAARV